MQSALLFLPLCIISVSKDFLDAGVHVLVEKPITVTVAEADELIAIAKRKEFDFTGGASGTV